MPLRIEFRLSMPGRRSWDGGWSGADRNFAVVRELSSEQLAKLLDLEPARFDLAKCRRIWRHRLGEGWIAEVAMRVVPLEEELPPSDGFNGYDWMIDNLLAHGTTYNEGTT